MKIKKFLQVVGFAPVFLLSQPTYAAALNIAQAPLFLGGAIEPNIMLILDDSGSMQFESLAEGDGVTLYLYPVAAGVYGGADYTPFTFIYRGIPAFNDTVDGTAQSGGQGSYGVWIRSNHVNPLFYNPEINYTPWEDETGASLDDADPACAWHNPVNTSVSPDADDCRDLTDWNTQTDDWAFYTGSITGLTLDSVTTVSGSQTFWPAVYYQYKGTGDQFASSSYDPVVIKDPSDGGDSSYSGGSGRSDCAVADDDPNTCTYDEEIQNFANWYTYYRSRILLARNGIGKAFASQSAGIRVGFATLNTLGGTIDGVSSTSSLVKGVRSFSGSDRTDFFDTFYQHPIPTSGTPSRRALDDVGQYFERTDDQGPWSATPGEDADTANDEAHHECRLSFSVLMTDGFWNLDPAGTFGANANVDNASGSTITDADGRSYQYTAANPYSDAWSGTLADVAMYYWYRDLRPDLANKVPTSVNDEAFWQHMVTYTVGLGVSGTLGPDDLAGLTSGTTSWPEPSTTLPIGANIDDLWHAAINSRGEFFSATDPEQFASTLEATLSSIGQRVSSAAAIATNSTRLNSSTFVYQARFDSTDWSGQFLAYQVDPYNGDVATTASWDSSAVMPAHSARTVLTYDPTANSGAGGGASFLWANLNATQKSQLNNGGSDTDGQNRLGWVRGDPSNEQRNGGTLRNRNSGVLGDIVNSDPWRVAQDNFGYHILPGTEGSSYITYRASTAYQRRSKVIYVGANDGMMHAFDAGTWNSTNQDFDSGTGVEKFAYVPNAVFSGLHQLTDPSYSHRYFVDGPSRASDAYIGGAWKTVLVGTLGGGGKGVFALDVTDPDSMDASKVLWELTDATDLGYTMGQPTVARMYNGHWAAIFGNGYNAASGKAILFIKDLEDGTVYKLDTEAGDTTSVNGLSTPTAIDINKDGIVDAIYAGDLFGNLWKFDVSDSNTNQWDVAYKSGSTPEPLFAARDASSNAQPITAKVDVGTHPNGGVMVYFGTGKYIEVSDVTSTDVQTLYAIWDDGEEVSGRSDLVEQEIILETTGSFTDPNSNTLSSNVRVTTTNTVDYLDDDGDPDRKGWYMDLVTPTATSVDGDGNITVTTSVQKGERVVSTPILHDGRILFTTMIPEANPCDFGGTSWSMDLTDLDGSQPAVSPFDLNNDGLFDASDYLTWDPDGDPDTDNSLSLMVSGKQSTVGITKTPAVIKVGDREYRYAGGSEGGIEKTTGARSTKTGRQSWWQIR